MRVRIVKEKSIRNFISQHPDSKVGFDDWCKKIKIADWLMPSDILNEFNTADLLGNGTSRIVFNIAGNHYRMICKYRFGRRHIRLFVKWMGKHADYSKLCNKGLQYSVNDF